VLPATAVADRAHQANPLLGFTPDEQIRRHGVPETITIDGGEANAAAIRRYHADPATAIIIRQVNYLNNSVEQDHRSVKRAARPMWGFTSCHAAPSTVVGIELMHMLRQGQREEGTEQGLTPAEPFYNLAAYSPPRQDSRHLPSKFATDPLAVLPFLFELSWR
jgi:putative transposase